MSKNVNFNLPLRPEKAGQMETITLVPQSSNGAPEELKALIHKRDFKIMGTLYSVPPLWNSFVAVGKLEGGETLLQIAEEKYQSYEMTGSGNRKFTVHLNQYKQLSSVSCIINAANWHEAAQAFHDLVGPYLSMLSWKFHTPMVLSNVNGTDIETNYHYANFIQPIPIVKFSIASEPVEQYNDHIAALFSFHREMINSTSGPYRLLCVFKCLTLVNQFKATTLEEVKAKGLDVNIYGSTTEVRIEDNEINRSAWPEAIGWKLGQLVKDKIRPMRNKIAHELDEGDQYANPDMGLFQEKIREYADAGLPLMRLQFKKIIDYRVANQVISTPASA